MWKKQDKHRTQLQLALLAKRLHCRSCFTEIWTSRNQLRQSSSRLSRCTSDHVTVEYPNKASIPKSISWYDSGSRRVNVTSSSFCRMSETRSEWRLVTWPAEAYNLVECVLWRDLQCLVTPLALSLIRASLIMINCYFGTTKVMLLVSVNTGNSV